jgi:hypothetical protein
MSIALYVVAGWQAIGILLSDGSAGKPRKPTTPGTAALIVAVGAAIITVLVLSALKLGAARG